MPLPIAPKVALNTFPAQFRPSCSTFARTAPTLLKAPRVAFHADLAQPPAQPLADDNAEETPPVAADSAEVNFDAAHFPALPIAPAMVEKNFPASAASLAMCTFSNKALILSQ